MVWHSYDRMATKTNNVVCCVMAGNGNNMAQSLGIQRPVDTVADASYVKQKQ